MLRASVVRDVAEFSALQTEWFDLVSRSQKVTIFDTFEWSYNWWNFIGSKKPGSKLQIVLLRSEDNRLVGIFPLYVSNWRYTPLRTLSMLGTGMSDYHDVICATGFEPLVCEACIDWLTSQQSWAVCDLVQLREGGTLRRYLESNRDRLTHLYGFELVQEECPILDMSGIAACEDRWQATLDSFGKKRRGSIRYYDRALERQFDVHCRLETKQPDINATMTTLFDLHRRRWNRRWLPGAFYSKSVQSFHRQVAIDLADQGWLRLHALHLNDRIKAVLYCFSMNGTTYYYQGGFDPELARFSLGTVIIGRAIRHAAREGVVQFDFLRGNEAYKYRWASGTSCPNKRWIFAQKSFLLFSIAEVVVRFEQRAELWLKDRMHHRKQSNTQRITKREYS
jgi:CelD/BcsL family acetyltransferase involved in cellulose biosynthesis